MSYIRKDGPLKVRQLVEKFKTFIKNKQNRTKARGCGSAAAAGSGSQPITDTLWREKNR